MVAWAKVDLAWIGRHYPGQVPEFLTKCSLKRRLTCLFLSQQGRAGDDLTSEVAHALRRSMAPSPSGNRSGPSRELRFPCNFIALKAFAKIQPHKKRSAHHPAKRCAWARQRLSLLLKVKSCYISCDSAMLSVARTGSIQLCLASRHSFADCSRRVRRAGPGPDKTSHHLRQAVLGGVRGRAAPGGRRSCPGHGQPGRQGAWPRLHAPPMHP